MPYGIRERSVMIALMALNREVTNAELENKFSLGLKPPQRTRLEQDGLITIRERRKRQYSYRLAEGGWNWVEKELTAPVPERAGSAGGGLYGLHAVLSARNLTLKALFDRKAPPPSPSCYRTKSVRLIGALPHVHATGSSYVV
jgi:hypothetical protein